MSYLGLGDNAPLGPVTALPVRGVAGGVDTGCDWPVAAWNSPVSASELKTASTIFGRGNSDLMT